jgi:hypothetical protein
LDYDRIRLMILLKKFILRVIKRHYQGHRLILSVELFDSNNKMFKHDNKVALITGANKDIGFEIRRPLAGKGITIGVCLVDLLY